MPAAEFFAYYLPMIRGGLNVKEVKSRRTNLLILKILTPLGPAANGPRIGVDAVIVCIQSGQY